MKKCFAINIQVYLGMTFFCLQLQLNAEWILTISRGYGLKYKLYGTNAINFEWLYVANQLLFYFIQYYDTDILNISMSKVQEFVDLIILIIFNGDFW